MPIGQRIVTLFCLLLSGIVTFPSWADQCPQYADDQPFAITELVSLIRNRSCDIKNIDDLLGRLPQRMSHNFALFYRSQSLQGPHQVNYVYPRAILSSVINTYDPATYTKALMLSFNGHPAQPGYDRIEVMDVDPSIPGPNIFNYFEIEFAEFNSVVIQPSWEEAQAKITISDPNPARCVQCHGNPARPIFQTYPIWEGAYGSRHAEDLSENERKGLQEFVKIHGDSTTSRYRHLYPRRFNTSPKYATLTYPPTKDSAIEFHSAKQTATISTDIANYNSLRTIRMIQRMPIYPYFKFALAAAVGGCENFPEFLPSKVFEGLKGEVDRRHNHNISNIDPKLAAKRFAEIHRLGETQFGIYPPAGATLKETIQKHKTFFGNDPFMVNLWIDTMEKQGADRIASPAASLRLIFEGLGYSMNRWFPDLKQPTYRFNSGFGQDWLKFLQLTEPDLGKGFAERGEAYEEAVRRNLDTCKNLARKSRSALSGFDVKAFLQPQKVVESRISSGQRPRIFETKCRTCHVDFNVGPYIPFNDDVKIFDWLRTDNHLGKIKYKVFSAPETERMPPDRSLGPDELKELREYLEKFD